MQFQLNTNKFSRELEKLILKFTYKWKGVRISKVKQLALPDIMTFKQSNNKGWYWCKDRPINGGKQRQPRNEPMYIWILKRVWREYTLFNKKH